MIRSILLFTLVMPAVSLAHNCQKFFNMDGRADEAYTCDVVQADLDLHKLYRMEVCIASIPYQPGERYAHAEYKYIDLDQYNNPYSKAENLNTKYVNSFYSGFSYQAYEGSDDNKSLYNSDEYLELRAQQEGSSYLNEHDSRISITVNKETGEGRMITYNRKSAYIFKNFWNKNWDVQLKCARVR